MGKRNKRQGNPGEAGLAPASRACSPPAKRPVLLAASVVFYVLWFVFLVVTAVFG